MFKHKNSIDGFSAVELLMFIVAVIIIGAVGYLVVSNHAGKNSAVSSPATLTKSSSDLSQITSSDEQSDKSADISGDSQLENNLSSANSSLNSVGNSYNENNY